MSQNAINHNVINILKNNLQKDISENLITSILDEAIENYKNKIKPIIKEHIERVVIDNIQKNENLQMVREDHNVFVKWVEEPATVSKEVYNNLYDNLDKGCNDCCTSHDECYRCFHQSLWSPKL